MPDSHREIYVHLIWATYLRQPLLNGATRDEVYAHVLDGCRHRNVEVVAFNGVEDHVHLLVRLPASVTIPDLAHLLKGRSSYLVRQTQTAQGFGWQEGYSAFSVSRWDVPKIREYIERQQEHHNAGTVLAKLEIAS